VKTQGNPAANPSAFPLRSEASGEPRAAGSLPAWSGTGTAAAPAGWRTSRCRSRRGKVSSCEANDPAIKARCEEPPAPPRRREAPKPPTTPQPPQNQELRAATALCPRGAGRAARAGAAGARGSGDAGLPGHVLVGGSLLPAELPAAVGGVDHLPGVAVGPGCAGGGTTTPLPLPPVPETPSRRAGGRDAPRHRVLPARPPSPAFPLAAAVLTHDAHHDVARDGDDQQDAADDVGAAPASGKTSAGDAAPATAPPARAGGCAYLS